MEHEVVEDRTCPGLWRVEAVNRAGDGEIYVTVFYGPQAKDRAEEYAAWKNAARTSGQAMDERGSVRVQGFFR